MTRPISSIPAVLLAVGIISCFSSNLFAQNYLTESEGSSATAAPSMFGNDDSDGPVVPTKQSSDVEGDLIQNAVLEGAQLSSEAGATADEKIVTCYFIFRAQPTSYFYDTKPKEKKIVFEFNDTELGTSPIPSVQESPIQGFRIEEAKVNVNEAVKGLTPEWHDVLRVSFFFENIPQIAVKDEFSVISFSFKWSSNPAKQHLYVLKQKKSRPLVIAGVGVGLLAAGGVAAYVLWPQDTTAPESKPIPFDDLPEHPTPP
jgi:hypothetical protein